MLYKSLETFLKSIYLFTVAALDFLVFPAIAFLITAACMLEMQMSILFAHIVTGLLIAIRLLMLSVFKIRYTSKGIKTGALSYKKTVINFFILPMIVGYISQLYDIQLSLESIKTIIENLNSYLMQSDMLNEYVKLFGFSIIVAFILIFFFKLAIFHLISDLLFQ